MRFIEPASIYEVADYFGFDITNDEDCAKFWDDFGSLSVAERYEIKLEVAYIFFNKDPGPWL